jgi:glycosyltransferase involved in cell wall biosynthesis
MLVSIITISFNSAGTIEKTVQSVVDQTYPDIEPILIDGGSTDGTLDVVGKYLGGEAGERGAACCGRRRAVIVSEPDGGIYDAMNKGVARATGDIVGILNSDDFYPHERVVERVVERFEKTGCDALYADCCYVDREETGRVTRYWKAGAYKPGAFKGGWMPPHPTFFVRKEHYDRLGAYRPEFRTAGDYELLLRFIHKHRLSLEYLPEVTVMMRTGGASNVSLSNRLRANREDREAWRVNGLQPAPWTLLVKPLRKVDQFFRRAAPACS